MEEIATLKALQSKAWSRSTPWDCWAVMCNTFGESWPIVPLAHSLTIASRTSSSEAVAKVLAKSDMA